MNCRNLALASMAAVTFAGAAQAEHAEIYAPLTKSSASSNAHQGPHVAGSRVTVTNATVNDQAAGPGGAATYDPLSATKSGVFASIPGGSGSTSFGGTAAASADLAAGTLKAGVSAYGPNFFGSHAGFATATLADTIYFTNSTDGDLAVTIRYSFDGTITDSNGDATPAGTAHLDLSCAFFNCYNENNVAIRFAGSGTQVGDSITAFFDEGGIRIFSRNIFGDQNKLFDHFDVWQAAPHGSGGTIDGWMQASLLIPTGTTSLGIKAILDLDCRGGSNCDFGHTGTLGFLGLPDGLSIGSASRVFPVPGTGGVGGVPEPASWALMILGFGFVGRSLRQRRAIAA